MVRGGLVEQLAEERIGLERIGLVDAGEPARAAARLAPLGEAEGEFEQPLAGLARDQQRLARLVVRHHALAHGGEQALGRLADEDEIDAALGGADDRARDAGNEPARPHAGIEVEDEAQLDLRHDLGVVGIADVRQPAGAEQDGVGLFAQLDRALRHRFAGVAIMAGARRGLGEAEIEPRRQGSAALRRISSAGAITSGPMPSPGSTAMWKASLASMGVPCVNAHD